MQISQLESWLALYHLPNMTPLIFYQLRQKFGPPEKIVEIDPGQLQKVGLPDTLCRGLREFQQNDSSKIHRAVQKDLAWAEQEQNHLLCGGDELYPPLLKEIHDPPPILYVQGNPEALSKPMLAMVGSRKPTAGGRRLARHFARQLSNQELGICSGLAYGIDSESHEGALDSKGLTVAVLGGGLDCIYPSRNIGLAKRVAEHGALMSEFPLGFQPRPWCFPRRNRVVTGLSKGVLVVEAALNSGSLISAHCALEQGREVFAIPGDLHNPQSKGCNSLIKQGASLVESVDDILNELNGFSVQQGLWQENSEDISSDSDNEPATLDEHTIKVLSQIGHDRISLDSLVHATKLKPSHLLSILAELELAGKIQRVSGGFSLA